MEIKVTKSEFFEDERKKLQEWLAQMNIFMSFQKNHIRIKKDKILLAASFLKDKVFNWFESYIRAQFHLRENNENDKNSAEMFAAYLTFMKKIMMMYGQMNEKAEAERQLE